MNRSVFILALLLALFVSGTAAAAEPWSSATGSDRQTIDGPAIENCQTLLDNNTYSCKVKSSFGTMFTDTFTFTTPGVNSAHFDLAVGQLPGAPLSGARVPPQGPSLIRSSTVPSSSNASALSAVLARSRFRARSDRWESSSRERP